MTKQVVDLVQVVAIRLSIVALLAAFAVIAVMVLVPGFPPRL